MPIENLRRKAGALFVAAQKAAELGYSTTSEAAHGDVARALQKLARAASLQAEADAQLERARQRLAASGVRPEGPPWGNAVLLRAHDHVAAGRVLATKWDASHWEVRGEAGGHARWVSGSDLQFDANAEGGAER